MTTYHGSVIDSIIDKFEDDKTVEVIKPMSNSNLNPIPKNTQITQEIFKYEDYTPL